MLSLVLMYFIISIPSIVFALIFIGMSGKEMERVQAMTNSKKAYKKVEVAVKKSRKWANFCFMLAGLKAVVAIVLGGVSFGPIWTALTILTDCTIYVLAGLFINKRTKMFATDGKKELHDAVKEEEAEKRAIKKEKLESTVNTLKAIDESGAMQHRRAKSDAKFERKMALEDRKLDRDDRKFDRKMDRSDRKFDRKMDRSDKRAEVIGSVAQAAIEEHKENKQLKRDLQYMEAREQVVRDIEAVDVSDGKMSASDASRRQLGRQLEMLETAHGKVVKDPEQFKEACARAGVDTVGKDLDEVAATIIKFAPTAYLERLPEDMPEDEKAMRIMQGAV